MTHEDDTPLHRGAEHIGGEVASLMVGKLRGRGGEKRASTVTAVGAAPGAMPTGCGHAPLLWREGKWVVEVWPLITSSRRDHSPPQGLSRVAVFSVVERKKERRNYLLFFPTWLDNSIPRLGGERAR